MFVPRTMLYLYPQHGGPALGFYCTSCGRVTRTENGMWRHVRIHGIKKQEDLQFKEKKDERTATVGA